MIGYGLTKASAGASAMTPGDARRARTDRPDLLLRSVGRPLTGTEVWMVDRAGRPLPTGTVGEIALRGPEGAGA